MAGTFLLHLPTSQSGSAERPTHQRDEPLNTTHFINSNDLAVVHLVFDNYEARSPVGRL
jgi:hypothetical protein